MDVMTMLEEARLTGLAVMAQGDKLVIRGPRQAGQLAEQLLARKTEILQALTLESLPPDWHFLWDERSAIMEYDGGMTREHAEAAALADILDQMRRAGIQLL